MDDPETGRGSDRERSSPGARGSHGARDWDEPVIGGDRELGAEPPPRLGEDDDSAGGPLHLGRQVFRSEHGAVVFFREVLGSILAVALVGLILFGVSGLWPPMVAVESGSMSPHLQRGDLVFVMEEHRLSPETAYADTGVVTARTGERVEYRTFGQAGDVIVYRKNGQAIGTPIIHRAMFWVNDSENWYEDADKDAIGSASSCSQLRNCPAPHAGFITQGDNTVTNERYDQVTGLSRPVKPDWVVGTAELRVPYLGWVRLLVGQALASAPRPADAGGAVAPGAAGHAGHGGGQEPPAQSSVDTGSSNVPTVLVAHSTA